MHKSGVKFESIELLKLKNTQKLYICCPANAHAHLGKNVGTFINLQSLFIQSLTHMHTDDIYVISVARVRLLAS